MEPSPGPGPLDSCPSEQLLEDYCQDRLPPSTRQAISDHAQRCPRCRDRLSDPEGLQTPTVPYRGLPVKDTSLSGAESPTIPRLEKLPCRLGQYNLLEVVGKGGMGVVYRAQHLALRRLVAVKVLPPGRQLDPELLARFRREIESLGPIDHPNVVRATDAGECGGLPFLAMELVEGIDLSRLIQAVGPLSPPDACAIVRQAAVGLEAIHQCGLVHRDLKPSNLILTDQGVLKVLDLGLARLTVPSAEELTSSHHVLGTLDYMAPEQGSNPRDVDIRADLYSLGCILFKLLTGQAPYATVPNDPPWRKIQAHAEAPLPTPDPAGPSIPPELLALLHRLLAKKRQERFATPEELARALTPFAQGSDLCALLRSARGPERFAGQRSLLPQPETPREPVPPREESVRAPAPPSPRRRRWPWLVSGLLVLASVAGLTWFFGMTPGRVAEQPARERTFSKDPFEPEGLRRSRLSRFSLNQARTELTLVSDTGFLVGLGETPADFRFEVWLEKIQDVNAGTAGIFLGFHEEEVDGRRQKTYLSIEWTYLNKNEAVLDLTRTTVTVPSKARTDFHVTRLRLPEVRSGEQHLGATVARGKLVGVRWNHNELPLKEPRLATVDCRGVCGVEVLRSSTVFRKPLFVLERSD